MKIGMFADSHYSSAEITCGCRYNSRSLKKITEAYAYFAQEQCDLVVCLGDLIDHEKDHSDEVLHLREIAAIIQRQKIRTIVLMGNHDAFSFIEEEFYGILGEECRPKTFNCERNTFFFVDACYFKNGERYAPGGGDWTDTFVPDLADIEQQLNAAAGDCYVFIHQNIDSEIRDDHRIYNDNEFRAVIERSKKVKVVYQGHYHSGHISENNGIQYITLPAMCEGENHYYVIKI